jgi:hypothetical protein
MKPAPLIGSADEPAGAYWTVRLAVATLILIALLYPGPMWGTHFPTFLGRGLRTAFLAAALALLVFTPVGLRVPGRLRWPIHTGAVIAAVGLGAGAAFFLIPTVPHIYGDALRNLRMVTSDDAVLHQLLSLDLTNRQTGEWFTLNLVRLLMAWGHVSELTAFRLIDATSGAVFVALWTALVLRHVRSAGVRALMIAVGATGGSAHLFTGHAEVYAPAAAALMAFLVVADLALASPSVPRLLLLLLCTLLAIKTHFSHHLLWLPFALVAIHTLAPPRLRSGRLFTRRALYLGVVVPLATVFAVYYVFVIGNAHGTRYTPLAERHTRMFLPLFNDEAPGIPAYTLFSPAHVADYVNLILLWSAPALLLAAWTWVRRRGSGKDDPMLLVTEVTLLAYAGVYFATNPLLTMPRDWDLFMTPAPLLLVYTLILIARTPAAAWRPATVSGPVLSLVAISLTAFVVNAYAGSTAERLRALGIHAYRTYYFGSAYVVQKGARLLDPWPRWQLAYRLRAVDEARAFRLPGDDPEFASLCVRAGNQLAEMGEKETGIPYLREALAALPDDDNHAYDRAEILFALEDYPAAYRNALIAVRAAPDDLDTQRLALNCAVYAGDAEGVITFGERILAHEPDDQSLRELIDAARSAAAADEEGR